MDENQKIKLLTFLLIVVIVVCIGFYYAYKKEGEKARSITTEQLMAEEYCKSLKYEEATWKNEFAKCLEYARQHPLETAKKLFSY